jgi:hypothetical protein
LKVVDQQKVKSEDRWVSLAYAWLGVPPMLIGGFWILYCYAFSSMVQPSLEGWERAKEILQRMFPGAIPGVFLAVAGAAFFLSSVAYTLCGFIFFRPTPRKCVIFLGLALFVSVIVYALT